MKISGLVHLDLNQSPTTSHARPPTSGLVQLLVEKPAGTVNPLMVALASFMGQSGKHGKQLSPIPACSRRQGTVARRDSEARSPLKDPSHTGYG
jgi:hypothetical protein